MADVIPIRAGSVLDVIGTVYIPDQPRFVVREHVKVDESVDDKVKIGYVHLHALGDLVEEPVSGGDFVIAYIRHGASDQQLLEELGDRRITFSQVFALLAMQGDGKPGALLTDETINEFFVPDSDKAVCRVRCRAMETFHPRAFGCWYVSASPLDVRIDPRATRLTVFPR